MDITNYIRYSLIAGFVCLMVMCGYFTLSFSVDDFVRKHFPKREYVSSQYDHLNVKRLEESIETIGDSLWFNGEAQLFCVIDSRVFVFSLSTEDETVFVFRSYGKDGKPVPSFWHGAKICRYQSDQKSEYDEFFHLMELVKMQNVISTYLKPIAFKHQYHNTLVNRFFRIRHNGAYKVVAWESMLAKNENIFKKIEQYINKAPRKFQFADSLCITTPLAISKNGIDLSQKSDLK